MYLDAYAHLYQKINGFRINVKTEEGIKKGFLSLKPSTRSTYDIAMRDATIDGLITFDEIEKIQAGQIFYRENRMNELYIFQSVNEFEFQKDTRNINAIKQNSFVTIKRKQYNEETGEEEYTDIYKDLVSFVTMQNKDEKNFAAGIENNTIITIQIPKKNISNDIYEVKVEDRIILEDLTKKISKEVKVESVNLFGVPGVIMIYGTFDTRTGD